MKLRVGTRESKLAVVQTEIVVSQMKALYPDLDIEIIAMTTTGDKLYNADLSVIGGKGLFLKELEEQLLLGNIDIAVHSLKDFPAEIHEDLDIIAYLEREEPYDAFLSNKYNSLFDMPAGSVLGTSSSRRVVQIKKLRPDIKTVPFRGNVATRMKKMEDGLADACILACAGLNRLGLRGQIKQTFSKDQMLPACGQGIICIEARKGDNDIAKLVSPLNHKDTSLVARAERAFTMALGGSCTTPIGSHAVLKDGGINLDVMYYHEESDRYLYASSNADLDDPESAGQNAAREIGRQLGSA